jgi:threonyl-tRNA synthetase
MRLLLIHSDWIEYEAKEPAGKWAEKLEEKKQRVEEALVVFVTAEREDENNPEIIVHNASDEIEQVANQLNIQRVVLYPYAHLSSSLASPDKGRSLLISLEETLEKTGLEVKKSPFGWYKSFKLSCKGHPLSELSREIKAEKKLERAVEAEHKLKSYWHILDLDGKLHELMFKGKELQGFDFSGKKNLKKFAKYEIAKERKAAEEAPHISLMKQLELVDYEPASDPGNLRFLPKGRLVKSLLEKFVTSEMAKNGALEVETPIMYDLHHPALENYLKRFPARQYRVTSPNKELFLRFSACFGQFLLAKDANLSYKHLPLWMFEMAKSFRAEQRGELTGLRRLRAFTMPDCHAICADLNQAKEEFLKRFRLAIQMQKKIGFEIPQDLELAIRATRSFFEENRDLIMNLVKEWGKPALVELWDEQFFYFILKYEFNFVDFFGKASALTTDQIDIENASRYGIKYETSTGESKEPLILHLSPSGAIERVMYALLERAWIRYKDNGEKPSLPFWLSPTQLRLIPVSQEYIPDCEQLAETLGEYVRVDIDEREQTVNKKIRDAEHEWTPLIVVYGDRERKSGKLKVRTRTDKDKEYQIEELKEWVRKELEGYPWMGLPLPLKLGNRPNFAR